MRHLIVDLGIDVKALSRIFNIPLNSQNIYLCCRKPKNVDQHLLKIAILVNVNCYQVSLAADDQDGNEFQLANLA